jgi:hypothetical protein
MTPLRDTASRSHRWLLAAAPGTAVVLAAASDTLHPASFIPLLSFHLAFICLATLIFIRPRSHAYSAFATVLLLGFWPKFLLRLFSNEPYLEPVGRFDGTTASWDQALLISSAGIAGVILARSIHLARSFRNLSPAPPPPPPFYERTYIRRVLWTGTAVGVAVAYAWNAYAAVYVTGVNPRVVLPVSGNALLSWCYIMIFPLWLALLVGWELARRRSRSMTWTLMLVPIAEAVLNAGSLLSRATYLLRVVPYLLAATTSDPHRLQLPRPRVLVASTLAAGFVVSIGAVMAWRTLAYLAPVEQTSVTTASAPRGGLKKVEPARDAPAAAPSGRNSQLGPPAPSLEPRVPATVERASVLELRSIASMVHEVQSLFLDRWTGLEGVLVVTSRFGSLDWRAVLSEDPTAGTQALYQHLAQSPYTQSERFTFLTLAGIVAVLATSGSLWAVFWGMVALTAMLIVAERTVRNITHNDIAAGVISVTGAFVTAQVTFPRLYAVFLIELWVTVGMMVVAVRFFAPGGHRRELSD